MRVWRSEGHDPILVRNMALIGVYDKTNPQTCLEGFCGDTNYNITPDCFEERRAACFNFSRGDTIEFFDDNIYNGFEYNYAVTTFDYGSTANIDPASLSNDLLYSPRFPDDENLHLRRRGQSDRPSGSIMAAAPPLDGAEIFVYPNPLRRGAGFKGSEGDQVVFTNLPPDSRIQVWTEDGDLVAELPRADAAPDRRQHLLGHPQREWRVDRLRHLRLEGRHAGAGRLLREARDHSLSPAGRGLEKTVVQPILGHGFSRWAPLRAPGARRRMESLRPGGRRLAGGSR